MIIQLFINACILITFITIAHNIVKDKYLTKKLSVFLKVSLGASCGLLGILLMKFSVPVTSTIIIDFRYLPIFLSAIYGGALPPIIASIFIGLFRILYFGITNASIIAVIDALIIGIGFSIFSLFKITKKMKWIYSIIYLLIVTSITTVIIIKNSVLLIKLLIIYPVATISVTYFIFKYTEYLSESVKLYRKLKNEATVDFLTGLNNVRQFDISFNSIIEQAINKGESVALLYLDIDYFKKINDTYGHSSGDIVLKKLADILRDTCKPFDIISRNGGEEFSVLLLDCSASNALIIGERIRKNVETNEFYISSKVSIPVTISIGISTYPDTISNIHELLESADVALYKAKKTGRNKVCMYDLNKISN